MFQKDRFSSDMQETPEEKKKKKLSLAAGLCILGAAGAAIFLVGGWLRRRELQAAISLIGGADGPTSVFIAGKINPGFYFEIIGLGAVAVAAAVWLFQRRR